jgi:hypothetical protein
MPATNAMSASKTLTPLSRIAVCIEILNGSVSLNWLTLAMSCGAKRRQLDGLVRRDHPTSNALQLRHDLFGFLHQLAHDLPGGRDIVDQLAGHTRVEHGIFDVWREAERGVGARRVFHHVHRARKSGHGSDDATFTGA